MTWFLVHENIAVTYLVCWFTFHHGLVTQRSGLLLVARGWIWMWFWTFDLVWQNHRLISCLVVILLCDVGAMSWALIVVALDQVMVPELASIPCLHHHWVEYHTFLLSEACNRVFIIRVLANRCLHLLHGDIASFDRLAPSIVWIRKTLNRESDQVWIF